MKDRFDFGLALVREAGEKALGYFNARDQLTIQNKGPQDLASEADAPSVPERWMDALRHFVLFRAWSVDAEFGGNATLAAAHRALYNEALGIQAQAAGTAAAAQK